jgi:hypothetical protein
MAIDFDTLRSRLLPAEVEPLKARNLLIDESHRRRPRYFDGRFLAARDLTRDQAYFLARQAAYARALGPGVVEGLEVSRGARTDTLRVSGGFGYTQAGEIVSLSRPVEVSLADMPALQLLNARLRLDLLKRPPLRNRSGVFVLGLRPLEFTANPVAAYPSGLDRERTVEAGDVVEAAALALYPLADAAPATLDAVRAQLARATFVERAAPAIPPEILPLAVVALAGDNLRWIDVHLVRRQAGQAQADVLGFGFAPRLLAEAHLAHYRARLDELAGRSFAAAQVFEALPPAGPLPDGAIDAASFAQRYFPGGVTTELSIVPDDELPALVEESLALPPLDLTDPPEALAAVFVSLLIPVARPQLRALAAQLEGRVTRLPTPVAVLGPVKRLPIDRLRLLAAPLALRPTFDANVLIDRAWRAALEAARGRLWFARRPNLAYNEAIAGRTVSVSVPAVDLEGRLNDRLRDFGVLTRFREVATRADVFGRAELTRLLASPALDSPVLMQSALTLLEAREGEKLAAADIAAVEAEVTRPGLGEGLARVAELKPELLADRATVTKLVSGGQALELDRHLAGASAAEVTRVTAALAAAAGGRTIDVGTILGRRIGG